MENIWKYLLGSTFKCFLFLSSRGVFAEVEAIPELVAADFVVENAVDSTLFNVVADDEHTCLDDFREFVELSPSVSAESVVELTDSAIDNYRNHSDNLEMEKKI